MRRNHTYIDYRLIIQELIKDFLMAPLLENGFEVSREVARNLYDLIEYWMRDELLNSEDASATLWGLRSFVTVLLCLLSAHII